MNHGLGYPYNFENTIFVNSHESLLVNGKQSELFAMAIDAFSCWKKLQEQFCNSVARDHGGDFSIVGDICVKPSAFCDMDGKNVRGMVEFEFSSRDYEFDLTKKYKDGNSFGDVLTMVVLLSEELKKMFPEVEHHIIILAHGFYSVAVVGTPDQLSYLIRAALIARDKIVADTILRKNHVMEND